MALLERTSERFFFKSVNMMNIIISTRVTRPMLSLFSTTVYISLFAAVIVGNVCCCSTASRNPVYTDTFFSFLALRRLHIMRFPCTVHCCSVTLHWARLVAWMGDRLSCVNHFDTVTSHTVTVTLAFHPSRVG